jgi:Tol biopolymer transport system component
VGPNTFLPRWSPDGRHLLFTSNPEGHNDLFLIDSQGGNPRRLTTEASNEVAGVFSRDGRWIYFHSDRTGHKQIWKMPSPLDGNDRNLVQVTRNGGISPEESPDGRVLYYLKEGNPRSLWKVPAEGGEEVQVISSILYDNFTGVEDGIFFVQSPGKNRFSLEFFDFESGKTTVICEPPAPGWGLTVSPAMKGAPRSILFVHCRENDSDLMLVENFR